MTVKALVFDMDGTLLNTLEDLANVTNAVLKEEGFATHPIRAYRQFVGSGARNLITRALPEEHRMPQTIDRCLKLFETLYAKQWDVKTHLYDGIEGLLNEAVSRGLRMAVLTNKPQAFADKCVSQYLKPWPWTIIQGQQPHLNVKPSTEMSQPVSQALNVAPKDIIYLGDSDVDMHTAKNAGYFALAVSWGFRSETELKDAGADAIIHHPSELWTLLNAKAEIANG